MMIWNVAISLRNEQQMAHAENFRMIRNAWFDHSWFLVFNPTFNNISVIPWLSVYKNNSIRMIITRIQIK